MLIIFCREGLNIFNVLSWLQYSLCFLFILEYTCINCQNLPHSVLVYFIVKPIGDKKKYAIVILTKKKHKTLVPHLDSCFRLSCRRRWRLSESLTPCNEKCVYVCNLMHVSQATNLKKKSCLKEKEMTPILVRAWNMELQLFLLTALLKLSARSVCLQEILNPQHRGNCNGKTHYTDLCPRG